jgi:hypothetical protein
MATRTGLLKAGKALRAVLFGLSQDGHYAALERDSFARLMTHYHAQLERFLVAPCCGDSSARYDPPLSGAIAAVAKSGQCQPGEPAGQQRLYDAVHAAAEGLKAVTGTGVTRAKVVAVRTTVRRQTPSRAAASGKAAKGRSSGKKAPAAGKGAGAGGRRTPAVRTAAKRAPARGATAKRKAPAKRRR